MKRTCIDTARAFVRANPGGTVADALLGDAFIGFEDYTIIKTFSILGLCGEVRREGRGVKGQAFRYYPKEMS